MAIRLRRTAGDSHPPWGRGWSNRASSKCAWSAFTMRYTLVREQNRNVAISVGVRPAAHNSRTCTASKEPYRACRNSASIHSCSGGGISSMVEPRTVRPPRYLGGVATLAIPKRPSLCQSHASWFRNELPLVPNHLGSGILSYALSPTWTVELAGQYTGAQFLLGDESNRRHKLAPYGIVNLGVRYE